MTRREEKPMNAGTAYVDITPLAGMHTFEKNSLTQLHWRTAIDPLYAKVLVLESGGVKACIISADINAIDNRCRDELRDAASKLGIAPEATVCHALQNHSCPQMGYPRDFLKCHREPADLWAKLTEGDKAYREFAMGRIIDAMAEANANLAPASLGAASGVEGRVAWNRRMVTKFGDVQMPLFMDPSVARHLEGPIDPELGVVSIQGEALAPIAMLVNYTCHPVNLHPYRVEHIISADWPGALSRELKTIYGEACTPLVLNGACGDVNPWDPWDPDFVRDHQRMGKILAKTAELVIDEITYTSDVTLDCRTRVIDIPWRSEPGEDLDRAIAYLAEHPEPIFSDEREIAIDHEWMSNAWRVETHERATQDVTYGYEIQVLRLNDVAVVCVPGEPFAELGLAIKRGSRAGLTYVVHMPVWPDPCYIPTPEAFESGGYETGPQMAQLDRNAHHQIVDAAIETIAELFA
jgi:neutral ceramidase